MGQWAQGLRGSWVYGLKGVKVVLGCSCVKVFMGGKCHACFPPSYPGRGILSIERDQSWRMGSVWGHFGGRGKHTPAENGFRVLIKIRVLDPYRVRGSRFHVHGSGYNRLRSAATYHDSFLTERLHTPNRIALTKSR